MIRFELRKGKTDTGTIQVRVVGGGINTKVTTGVKLKVKEWIAEAQALKHPTDVRPQATLQGMSYAELSERLTELRRELDVVDKRGEATSEAVRKLVTEVLKEGACRRVVDVRRGCFVRFVEQYINEMKTGTRTKARTHERIREYYPKQYEPLLAELRRYEHDTCVDIGWGSLTKRFFERFCLFLADQGKGQNTIALYTQKLAQITKEAIRQKLVTCDTDISEWKVPTVLTDQVALSEEKLNELFTVNLMDVNEIAELTRTAKPEDRKFIKWETKTPCRRRKLQESLNIFLVCCLTGQRFSDYQKITSESICTLMDGREYIRIKQQKTGHDLYIPVDPRLKDVLSRPQWPKSITQMNRNIKYIGRILGWTELTGFSEEKNGLKYKSQRPYFEYLKSHTARRTFATLAYKRGVSLEAIMAVTGHKSEESLRRYIRVDAEEKAMMASKELFKIRVAKEA